MQFQIEIECEDDGRWIADIPTLPGAMAYGNNFIDAICNVKQLACIAFCSLHGVGSEDFEITWSQSTQRPILVRTHLSTHPDRPEIANDARDAAEMHDRLELRALARILRDETNSASVHARCVAIVGEKS